MKHSKTHLYDVWAHIKYRCNTQTCSNYKNYGARGIKVCEEWSKSFETFREWAMSHGYKPGLTIERIDNNGDYTPENCKWATLKEQGQNRRDNRYVTVGARTMTLAAWCDFLGIPRGTVSCRLSCGCTILQALGIVPIPRGFVYQNRAARKKGRTAA